MLWGVEIISVALPKKLSTFQKKMPLTPAEKQRRYRLRLKLDPIKNAEVKRKQLERYHLKKELVKCMTDLKHSDNKRKWNAANKRRRERQKAAEQRSYASKADTVQPEETIISNVKVEQHDIEFENANINQSANYNTCYEDTLEAPSVTRRSHRYQQNDEMHTYSTSRQLKKPRNALYEEENPIQSPVAAKQQLTTESFESYNRASNNRSTTILDIDDEVAEVNNQDLINIEEELDAIKNLMPRSKESKQLQDELSKAETEYYRCKAAYFTKLTENCSIKRTLMLLESRKLQLEIEKLTNESYVQIHITMSENILQSDTNETNQDYAETVASQQMHSSWNEEQQTQNEVCNKQQLLSEKTSIIFQELNNTLENEQAKLFELEDRRKKLQEEMLLLKAKIEKEMQSFNLNIMQSVSENLTGINNIENTNSKVCDESKKVCEDFKSHAFTVGDEQHQCVTLRNLSATNSQELNEEIGQSTPKKEVD